MKREEVLTILDNPDLDSAAKLKAILDLNGADINAKNSRIKDLETQIEAHASEINGEREKYKDYDAILQERDSLLKEKEDRAFSDRFAAVLGKNEPKNDFTRKGMEDLFRSEIAKEENKGKTDEDIFKAMSSGKETEWFNGTVNIRMTPTNPDAQGANSTQAYLDKLYADNPFYQPTNKN